MKKQITSLTLSLLFLMTAFVSVSSAKKLTVEDYLFASPSFTATRISEKALIKEFLKPQYWKGRIWIGNKFEYIFGIPDRWYDKNEKRLTGPAEDIDPDDVGFITFILLHKVVSTPGREGRWPDSAKTPEFPNVVFNSHHITQNPEFPDQFTAKLFIEIYDNTWEHVDYDMLAMNNNGKVSLFGYSKLPTGQECRFQMEPVEGTFQSSQLGPLYYDLESFRSPLSKEAEIDPEEYIEFSKEIVEVRNKYEELEKTGYTDGLEEYDIVPLTETIDDFFKPYYKIHQIKSELRSEIFFHPRKVEAARLNQEIRKEETAKNLASSKLQLTAFGGRIHIADETTTQRDVKKAAKKADATYIMSTETEDLEIDIYRPSPKSTQTAFIYAIFLKGDGFFGKNKLLSIFSWVIPTRNTLREERDPFEKRRYDKWGRDLEPDITLGDVFSVVEANAYRARLYDIFGDRYITTPKLDVHNMDNYIIESQSEDEEAATQMFKIFGEIRDSGIWVGYNDDDQWIRDNFTTLAKYGGDPQMPSFLPRSVWPSTISQGDPEHVRFFAYYNLNTVNELKARQLKRK